MASPEDITTITTWLGSGSINIFGPPFAGKDSQGRRLETALGAVRLGGGDILRGSKGMITPEVRATMDRGELIPTPDFVKIVFPFLGQSQFEGKPFVLSAVGRMEGEQEGVMEVLENAGHPLKAVVNLQLDESVVFERRAASELESQQDQDHRGHRDDHDYETVLTRVTEFKDKTLPVIEYYRQLGLVIDIDANQPKHIVFDAIINALAWRSRS